MLLQQSCIDKDGSSYLMWKRITWSAFNLHIHVFTCMTRYQVLCYRSNTCQLSIKRFKKKQQHTYNIVWQRFHVGRAEMLTFCPLCYNKVLFLFLTISYQNWILIKKKTDTCMRIWSKCLPLHICYRHYKLRNCCHVMPPETR